MFFDHWYRVPVVQHYPGRISQAGFEKRIGEINRFEKMLAEEGMLLKLDLHLSRGQQRKRLKKLEGDSAPRLRVTEWDRLLLKHYEGAKRVLEEMIRPTSYGHAPWTIIDAADR